MTATSNRTYYHKVQDYSLELVRYLLTREVRGGRSLAERTEIIGKDRFSSNSTMSS
jgi:hypothetical protein